MSAPFAMRRADVAAQDFTTIERYWADPDYRAQLAQERNVEQARVEFDIELAQIRNGTRWPAHWTDAEKAEASAKVIGSGQ